jgi:hypothetical protein
MRAAKLLAVLAIAALGIGSLSAVALAGKKRHTNVVFFTGSPKFCRGPCNVGETDGMVYAKGWLNATVTARQPHRFACQLHRLVRLQVLDANGEVLATIAEDDTPDHALDGIGGNWKLLGHLPTNLPAGTNSVRVKAKKRTAGEFVCKAGVSISVPIPVPIPGQKLGR